MKKGIIIVGLGLSLLLGSVGYADNIRPAKNIVTKTITVTRMPSPIRNTIRGLRTRLKDRGPLRRVRNTLRNLLCIQCVKDTVLTDVEVLPSVEVEIVQ